MGDLRNEPSMEDILASIKRIIAEDSAAALGVGRARPLPTLRSAPVEPEVHEHVEPEDESGDADQEEVLELTQTVPEERPELVSTDAAAASRQSLEALSRMSRMAVRPEPGQDNTLEGLVREMLRPMLKEWLDTHLPEMVEGLVAREIARITGRTL